MYLCVLLNSYKQKACKPGYEKENFYMSFLELIKKRYSCRAYLDKEIPKELLEQVLEAGCLAPTAANRQAFKIVVIETKKYKEVLAGVYGREWFISAPYVLAVAASNSGSWIRPYDERPHHEVDASIVMDHLILSAADLGLGTCWVCAFDPEKAKGLLALEDDFIPVAFTPLGYAADQLKEKKRKDEEELVIYLR